MHILDFMIQGQDLAELMDKVDDQTSELIVKVWEHLLDRLDISPDEQAALQRLRQAVEQKDIKNWEGMHRNNIFKAAIRLGIKVPSHSF